MSRQFPEPLGEGLPRITVTRCSAWPGSEGVCEGMKQHNRDAYETLTKSAGFQLLISHHGDNTTATIVCVLPQQIDSARGVHTNGWVLIFPEPPSEFLHRLLAESLAL